MKKLYVTTLLVALMAAGSAFADTTFTADRDHSTIGFAVQHLVISKVKGQFTDFHAVLVLDDNDQLVSAEANVQVTSVDTRNQKRDDHLRSPEFFSVSEFPAITFKSTSVAGGEIVGNLTIRDVTREIHLPYTIKGPVKDPWGNTKIGFESAITINRKDYGLTWNKLMESGGMVVGEEVELSFEMEFVKQK